jgi:hypothetical protein
MTRIALCAAAALLGFAGSAPAGSGDPSSRLIVKGTAVDTGSVYIEGAFQYVVVMRRQTGARVLSYEFGGRVSVDAPLRPGRYRLVSYTRPCSAVCHPTSLDAPTDRCSRAFTLRRGRTVKLVLRIGDGIPCRATVVSSPARG